LSDTHESLRVPHRSKKNLSEQAGPVAGLPAGNAANWDDEDPLPRRLSATEAEAFRDQRTAPSPWRVVLVQAEAGAVISLLVGLVFGWPALWSALYGAATAIVPGALMARGATRMADSKSPLATALSLLGWESAKIVCSVAMLVSRRTSAAPGGVAGTAGRHWPGA
jgi:ATP synthase protein I